MKKFCMFVCCLIPGGCQTTPGFTWSFAFTVPPTINATNTLHPVATMPAMSYAIEAPQQATVVQRQYLVPSVVEQAPLPAPAIRPRPQAEQIPLPKAPCTPLSSQGGQPVAQIVSAE